MSTHENWGAEPLRQPSIIEGDEVIFSEHGRVINNTDYRSHWFKFVKAQFGGYYLLIKHGGGEERISLGYTTARGLKCLEHVEADQRYLIMWTLMQVNHDARDTVRKETATRYQMAFLDGRLKRRKRNHNYYVEILPKEQEVTK